MSSTPESQLISADCTRGGTLEQGILLPGFQPRDNGNNDHSTYIGEGKDCYMGSLHRIRRDTHGPSQGLYSNNDMVQSSRSRPASLT